MQNGADAVDSTLGARLAMKRKQRALTQEQLAARTGVSQAMIARTEQGRRVPRLPVLLQLARALDTPLSELVDTGPGLDGHSEGASIVAVRNALLSPAVLPGVAFDAGDTDPAPAGQLRASVDEAARLYWAGDFTGLTVILPALINEARLTCLAEEPAGHSLHAQVYDLASALMVQMGKEDLAGIAAERAVTAAQASGDELLHAKETSEYAWILLYQGRMAESENLAAATAERIEPSFAAPDNNVAVYGHALMIASAAAAARGQAVEQYISLASAAAARLGREMRIYQTSTFGLAGVNMQACHVHAVRREPARALDAARKIRAGDLEGICYARHLLDVAQAHADTRQFRPAVAKLTEARALAPAWFRHQGVARSLVDDIFEQEKRISPALRELGASIDADWYAPYHRPHQ